MFVAVALMAHRPGDGGGRRTGLAPVRNDDVSVTDRDGFRIEVVMRRPGPARCRLAGLTDFGRMARFVPRTSNAAKSSRKWQPSARCTTGTAYYGPFSMAFASVRDIELRPKREILARQLSGTARAMESVMRLDPLPNGRQGHRLAYRAEVVPEGVLPPLVGPAAIRGETAGSFRRFWSRCCVGMPRGTAGAKEYAGRRSSAAGQAGAV